MSETIAAAGVVGTIGPVVLTLRDGMLASTTDNVGEACSLNAPQIALIQAAVSLNTSCAYNMTISSVLEL